MTFLSISLENVIILYKKIIFKLNKF